ncbi:MAG: hypothetical protein ACXW2L_14495, partial [Burkholderiales bacterium]
MVERREDEWLRHVPSDEQRRHAHPSARVCAHQAVAGSVVEKNSFGYAKWADGRIDDPSAGWKGKGLWATTSTRAPFDMEAGAVRVRKSSSFNFAPTRSRGDKRAGAAFVRTR